MRKVKKRKTRKEIGIRKFLLPFGMGGGKNQEWGRQGRPGGKKDRAPIKELTNGVYWISPGQCPITRGGVGSTKKNKLSRTKSDKGEVSNMQRGGRGGKISFKSMSGGFEKGGGAFGPWQLSHPYHAPGQLSMDKRATVEREGGGGFSWDPAEQPPKKLLAAYLGRGRVRGGLAIK